MPERILALVALYLLVTPLLKTQREPRWEKQRTQLFLLISILGLTMITMRFVAFLTASK